MAKVKSKTVIGDFEIERAPRGMGFVYAVWHKGVLPKHRRCPHLYKRTKKAAIELARRAMAYRTPMTIKTCGFDTSAHKLRFILNRDDNPGLDFARLLHRAVRLKDQPRRVSVATPPEKRYYVTAVKMVNFYTSEITVEETTPLAESSKAVTRAAQSESPYPSIDEQQAQATLDLINEEYD